MPLVPSSRPSRFRAVYVLAAAAAVLAVSSLVVWKIRAIQDSSSRKATRSQFAWVALSLVNYSEFRGHLPHPIVRQGSIGPSTEPSPPKVTDRPLYSWRVEIIPYLESWHGTWDPSQPWDHPLNKQIIELSSFYTYDATRLKGNPQSFSETNLLAITGPGTAFGDGKGLPMTLKNIPPYTILVVETRASTIPWPAPGDFDIRTMPQTINALDGKGISGRSVGGFHLIFANGQTWFLSDKLPFDTLKKFFTTIDAGKYDAEELLGPFALHRGP